MQTFAIFGSLHDVVYVDKDNSKIDNHEMEAQDFFVFLSLNCTETDESRELCDGLDREQSDIIYRLIGATEVEFEKSMRQVEVYDESERVELMLKIVQDADIHLLGMPDLPKIDGLKEFDSSRFYGRSGLLFNELSKFGVYNKYDPVTARRKFNRDSYRMLTLPWRTDVADRYWGKKKLQNRNAIIGMMGLGEQDEEVLRKEMANLQRHEGLKRILAAGLIVETGDSMTR